MERGRASPIDPATFSESERPVKKKRKKKEENERASARIIRGARSPCPSRSLGIENHVDRRLPIARRFSTACSGSTKSIYIEQISDKR